MNEKHDKSGLAGSGGADRLSQTHLILGRSPAQAQSDHDEPAIRSTIDPKWRQSYEQLLQTRDYVLDRALSMKVQGAETQPKDRQQADAESATTVSHRDFSFAQASAYNELLGEINHALRRIEEGRYGVCEITGKPIPMRRLKAIPWTRFVAAAERKLEKHGRSPVHFKLPPAGGLKGGGFSEEPLSTEPEETEGGEE